MADEVAVLDDGRLRQVGPPEAVYADPADRFVADFLGTPAMNQLPAVVRRADGRVGLLVDVGDRDGAVGADGGSGTGRGDHDTDGTVRFASLPGSAAPVLADGDRVTVGVRPEHLRVSRTRADDGFRAQVAVVEYQGSDNFLHLRVGSRRLTAVVPPSTDPDPGATVPVSVPPGAVHLFDAETGTAIRTAGGAAAAARSDGRTDGRTDGDAGSHSGGTG